MLRRDILSWWLRPGFLRTWGRKAEVLFAGPWVGEFGWELMNWQGFVRKLSRQYDKTIVCCQEGHEALYADFAGEILTHRLRGTAECNVLRDIQNPDELKRIEGLIPPGCDYLKPLGHQPFSRQEFIRFGKKQSEKSVDILFHARGRGFDAHRNWSVKRWQALLTLLLGEGYRVGCIGLRDATLAVEGAHMDLRDRPLSETLDTIASAGMVVGPSSGPLHLAGLCGTPHVVWTDQGRYARGHSSRDKYETLWNPFKTPVKVLDEWGFDPPPDAVFEKIRMLMKSESRLINPA